MTRPGTTLAPYAVAMVTDARLLRCCVSPWRPGWATGRSSSFSSCPSSSAAYLGGLRPGLFATALAGLVADYFVLPPTGTLRVRQPARLRALAVHAARGRAHQRAVRRATAGAATRPRECIDRKHAATERKVRLGFAVAIAFLGAIGIVSYLSVVRLNENSQLVTRSHAVMSNIDALVATTFESESAQRAYIITGEEPFAADYTRAIGRVDGLLQELRDAVRDYTRAAGARRRRWPTRCASACATATRSSSCAAAPAWRPCSSAWRRVASRPGATLQAELRRLAQEMKTAEIVQLNAREHEAQRSALASPRRSSSAAARWRWCSSASRCCAIRRDFAGRARAEAELNRFFDLSIDLFTIAGADGYFKRLSPAVTDMLGYSIEEALRIPYMDLVHPDDQAPRARRRASPDRARRAHRRVRRAHAPQGRQLAHAFLALDAARRPHVRHRARRHRRRARLAGAARGQGTARSARRGTHARTRAGQRVAAQERATIPRAHREQRRLHLAHRGGPHIPLPEPVGHAHRGLHTRRVVRPAWPPTRRIPTISRRWRRPWRRCSRSPGKPIPAVWRRRHKDGHWIWLEGVATNLLDDPVGGRHRLQLPRHHRSPGARTPRRPSSCSAWRCCRASRAPSANARTCAASSRRWCATSRRSCRWTSAASACTTRAANQLSVSCVGASSEPLSRAAGPARRTHCCRSTRTDSARCVRGHLVYEPDIAAAQLRLSAAPGRRRHALAGDRAAAGGEPACSAR